MEKEKSAWKAPFKSGVLKFRAGNYEDAIACFSEALTLGGDGTTIYDARAAVYQKLGKVKEALRDSKMAIDLGPDRWQGYARSARLFFQLRKFEAASRMVDLALERIPSDQSSRRDEMLALQDEIRLSLDNAAVAAARLASQRAYHFGRLPVEIANAIFSVLLTEDHAYVVTLAQVCKNWRDAIIGWPAFWRTLVLTDNHPKRKIKVWKERSKDRIGELALLTDFTDSPSILDELAALSTETLRALRLETFPIHQLYRHLPSIADAVMRPFQGLRPGMLLSQVAGDLWRNENVPTFACRVLNLLGVLAVPMDWSQLSDGLTDLESCTLSSCLGPRDWHHLLWLLHRNPNLVQLDVITFAPIAFDVVPDREVPPILALSKLATLRITSSVPDRLLPLLTLPSLTTLELSSCRQRLTLSLRHLADGAASTLTSLSIQRSTFDPQLLIGVLAAATSLESLQLLSIGDNMASVVLEALARPLPTLTTGENALQGEATRIYCPALRRLDCSHNSDVRGGALVRLVKLRLAEVEESASPEANGEDSHVEVRPVQPLQVLVVDVCPALDPDILPWLRAKVPTVSCQYMSKKAAGWKR